MDAFLFLCLCTVIGFLAWKVSELRRRVSEIEDKLNTREPSPKSDRKENRFTRAKREAKKEAKNKATPPPLPADLVAASRKKDTVAVAAKATTAPTANSLASTNPPSTPPRSAKKDGPTFEDFLRRIHLMPPKAGEDAEASVVGWWATRVGVLLAVLALVFLGIYVGNQYGPVFRWALLLMTSLGVFGLGTFFERKVPSFGRALASGGLAMLFFTAYAAYAVPPTKIIASSDLGFLLQFGAVGLFLGWSFWKNHEGSAALALGLGHVATWFSLENSLTHFSILNVLFLLFAGGLFAVLRPWRIPLGVAGVGAGFSLALFRAIGPWRTVPPNDAILIGLPAVLITIVWFSDWFGVYRDRGWKRNTTYRRLLVLGSIGSLILGGLFLAAAVGGIEFEHLHFAFAATLIGGSAAHLFLRKDGGLESTLVHGLFLKGSLFLALGLATAFAGPARWIALGLQALLVLHVSRRTQSRWVELASLGFLLWSLLHFLFEMDRWGRNPDLTDRRHILGLIFGGMVLAWAVLRERWAVSNQKQFVPILAALASGAVLLGTLGFPMVTSGQVIALGVTGALLALIAPACRSYLPLLAGAVPFALAHLFQWGDDIRVFEVGDWNSASILLVLSLGIATALALAPTRWPSLSGWKQKFGWGELIALLFALNVGAWMIRHGIHPMAARFTLFAGITCLAATTIPWLPFRKLREISLVPAVLSLIPLSLLSAGDSEGTAWLLWLGLALILGALVLSSSWEEPLRMIAQSVFGVVLLAASFFVGLFLYDGGWSVLVPALAAFALTLLWRNSRGSCEPGAPLGVAGLGLTTFVAAGRITNQSVGGSASLWPYLILAALVVVHGILVCRTPPLHPLRKPPLPWGHGLAALAMAFLAIIHPNHGVDQMVTPSWGLAGILLWLPGFLFGLRSYRILGLAGVGICILRMFIVDIDDTFYRIAAFGATAVVLLVVGYLYTRFAERLREGDLDLNDGAEGPASLSFSSIVRKLEP